jgi:hypothetical protein
MGIDFVFGVANRKKWGWGEKTAVCPINPTGKFSPGGHRARGRRRKKAA